MVIVMSKKDKTKNMKTTERIRQFWIGLMFVVMCVIIIFPFLLLLSVSFSDEKDIASTDTVFFRGFSAQHRTDMYLTIPWR